MTSTILEVITRELLQQVHIDSVEVEVTEDLFEDGSRPNLELEASPWSFTGLPQYTISRGNNLLAPERIWGARASRIHTMK